MATQKFDTKTQDPADKLDYLIDWRSTSLPAGELPFLAEDEVISTVTFTAHDDQWATTTDITIDQDLSDHTDTTTTVWVSGGVAGKTYYATTHIVTDQGRAKDRSIKLLIKEQ